MSMTQSSEQDIVALEKAFFQTMVDKDVKTATAMVGDPAIVTGAQGASAVGRSEFSKMMAESTWELLDFALEEPKVSFPTDRVAVIGYKVRQTVRMDGQTHEMHAADASTWVRDGKKWLCVQHSESLLGDPFGRAESKH